MYADREIHSEDDNVANVLPLNLDDLSLAAVVNYLYDAKCDDDVARATLSDSKFSLRRSDEIMGALKLKKHTESMRTSTGTETDPFNIEI